MFNHASRLTTNLLFHDIGHVLQRITGTSDIAYSPVMDSVPRSVTVHGGIRILSHNKEINIYISMQDLPAEQSNALQAFFGEISVDLKNIYQLVFKKKCSTSYIPYFDKKIYVRHYKEIVISVINNDREQYLNLLIPVDFFTLFSKNINLSSSSEFIEGEVLNFFKNPRWMIPELIFLFSALSNVELNSLINQLQRKNLLTPYQIFLIIQGLPDLSGLIKSVLSKNAINDVIQFNKKSEAMKINRRDIAGGLYSVEESIFFIMRDGSDLHYSQFLRSMQSIIRSSLNYDILLKKKFSEWISDIITDDLLYATLSVTEDAVSALALSRESPTLMDQFREHISVTKIKDIRQLIKRDAPYEEVLHARIVLLSHYREHKMNRIHIDPDRLEYLIVNFCKASDYLYLLLSVGWFTLSTAMKGMNQKNIALVLAQLPVSARILIEDVLKGIVNPNILHDEMQVARAKTTCVESILRLYNDGIITLDM
jgi:hypothetical protein